MGKHTPSAILGESMFYRRVKQMLSAVTEDRDLVKEAMRKDLQGRIDHIMLQLKLAPHRGDLADTLHSSRNEHI